jgi:hypothetical protein
MNELDHKIIRTEENDRHISYKFSISTKPSGELIKKIIQDMKSMDRQKEEIELIFPNNQSDELSLTEDELNDLIMLLLKRQKNIYSFTLNLNNWCYIYTIMPKLLVIFNELQDLTKLEICANNTSLNPSFSNSAMVNLGKMLLLAPKLRDLSLEFADTSP